MKSNEIPAFFSNCYQNLYSDFWHDTIVSMILQLFYFNDIYLETFCKIFQKSVWHIKRSLLWLVRNLYDSTLQHWRHHVNNQQSIPGKNNTGKNRFFLFFDIETTGFSKDNTILYLIGCGYFIENGFQFIQWFNDDGTSEEEILLAFHDILKQKDWQLVTFNGNSFDIPYLKRHYELNELPCDIESFPSLDFYQF